MLSPTMITKSYLNFWRNAAICLPTSYWACAPVPVSPMTANLHEPSLLGSRSSCAYTGAAAASSRASAASRRRERLRVMESPRDGGIGDDVAYEVEDHVRFRVAEDQRAADEAVPHLLGQRRDLEQQAGRHGGEGRVVGVHGVDTELHGLRRFLGGIPGIGHAFQPGIAGLDLLHHGGALRAVERLLENVAERRV